MIPAPGRSVTFASAQRSLAGLSLAASALVHAAMFAVLGPFASSGARVPAARPAGPVLVRVSLAPWPAEARDLPRVETPAPLAPRLSPPARRAPQVVTASAPMPPIAAVRELPEGVPSASVPADAGGATAASATHAAAGEGPAPTDVDAVLLPASYLHAPQPEYPLSARQQEQEGLVVLRVRISTRGLPAEIVIGLSSGFRALDRAAVAGVKRWSFTPARRGAEPIEAWMDVPIRFRLG